MNKSPYLLLLVFTLLFTSCTNAQEPSEIVDSEDQPERVDGLELKVLSYNVHHCNPASKPGLIDVDGIAKVIIDSKADVVGLQEIDVNNERSGKHLDQAKELARLTGMEFYFSKGIDYKGGAFGTAILSKYPISQMETLYLPEETGTERRTLSIITVEFPEGKKIRFGNTHLDYTSDDNALAQAKAITSYFENEALPVVLVGDFNVEANSKTMAHLDKTYNRTCAQGCPNTFPVVKPSKAIDFILYSSGFGIQTLFHEVIQEHYASDHLPVLAKLRFEH